MAEQSPYSDEEEVHDGIYEEVLAALLLALALAAKESSFEDMQEAFQRETSKALPAIIAASLTALNIAVKRTERQTKLKNLTFDYSEEAISSRAVTALTNNIQSMIQTNEAMYQEVLDMASEFNWSEGETLKRLKSYYGLTPTHVRTVIVFEQALAREGASRKTIATKTKERKEGLIDWRNELVADNVATDAIQGSKEALFSYFLSTGQVDRDYVKEWVAVIDDRTSSICLGLNKKTAELDGVFEGGYLWPPAHGHCRSSIRIVKRSNN